MGIPESPPGAIAGPGIGQAISADVAVIGAGVIGHGIAWEARRSGRSVVLIDDAPGSGASWAAAGMLAPVSELHYQEEELLALMLDASERWPQFAADLAGASGRGCGYLTTPTLTIGADAADRQALMDLRGVQQANKLAVEPLTVREARRREPLLSPGIACALDTPADHQVDPRRLVECFRAALANHLPAGSSVPGPAVAGTAVTGAVDGFAVADRASALEWAGGAVAGVRLSGGGLVLAGETVVANGMAAGSLGNLPEGLRLPLRPVHGDILRLAVPQHLQPLLTSTVRGLVRGVPVYLVPRGDGTVVIGATQREDALAGAGATSSAVPAGAAPASPVSAGGVYQLLRDAQALVPAVAELELLECTARARPATPDNAPLLGRVPVDGGDGGSSHIPGLIVATGFFRHGVLLTPAAAAVCRDLMDGKADPRWQPFSPDRFSGRIQAPSFNIKETA
ncbi:glycine oxidase ThiO [Pseudarthrobacter chlorophenolicus A6]|uniref:Glycine oxidase ThiO n=1 Tax=Pseudarthrobacter chlorophenolicus (strain ATCC 700700 / DSM 12829 / CIP 107037 / JCM 12360 / KCTC 9906 / NCIMB 13794 / A6) TaxID=452863 RepID=B8HBS9_PSECP|nr:FAD-dependent oxidoreductase [Pseudarthrobacter chlorophenolicus]ACL40467.1 glycine oxidase ThiO [Pseudarthrobacter chlorophenolicus A6]SDQ81004.1 glycine oxidase [Pseudarthrobacter chlorophenolicus]